MVHGTLDEQDSQAIQRISGLKKLELLGKGRKGTDPRIISELKAAMPGLTILK